MTQRAPLPYGNSGRIGYDGYYHHSGQINFTGVIGSLIIGLVVGFALAWLYVLADLYIPIVQLNAISCAAMGAMLGLAPAVILRKMKVRNVPVSLAVVGVVSLFAYYVTWAAWEYMILRSASSAPTFIDLALRPDVIFRIAQRVNEVGTWKMSEHDKDNVTGWFLLLIWLAEAAGIFVTALLLSRTLVAETPFCERCNRWCEKPKVIRTTGPGDPATVREHLESKDFTFLDTLGAANQQQGRWLECSQHRCGGCGELNTLTVTDVKFTRDKKGRTRTSKKVFVKKLLLTADEVQDVLPPPPEEQGGPAPAAV